MMMQQWIESMENLCREIGCRFSREESLTKLTTFKAGGPAQLAVHAKNKEQAAALWKEVCRLDIPVHVLGKGSNLLVSDEGVRGLVLHLDIAQEPFSREENQITAWAGQNLSSLCIYALEQEMTGLEFAYGIPGSVGGAVYMNAGAYGGEIKDCLRQVRFLDENGQEHTLAKDELELSYRHSCFTGRKALILEAEFDLQPGCRDSIREKMDDVMERRRSKQPLEHPSAGSTFKRPEGAFASALIDQCGLKGLRSGGASVSTKHAGFIVNDQQGTCRDILSLIEKVREEVYRQTGYQLETEVEYWD